MIEFGKLLYGSTSKVNCIDKKVGSTGLAGLGMSEHRHGVMGAPKVSTVALLFDLLYDAPKSAAIYASADGVCLEVDGEVCYATEECIAYTPEWDKPKYSLIADALVSTRDNLELSKSLAESISALNAGDTTAATQSILTFCDSYYYGNAKNSTKTETTISKDEITAGLRSGFFQNGFGPIPDSKLGKSVLGELKKEKAPKKVKKDGKSFIQECKEGKYIVPYSWPECMKRFIKPASFLDTFESTPEFEEIVKKIAFRAKKILERLDMGMSEEEAIGRDALNIMLLGKPGTGKTTLAYALSAATGMPVCTTAWNKHSDEDEVEGKTKIVDGKPQFVETNSLLFHQFGGIDVNEEINLADPSVTMGSLGQKLEYPYIVKRNGYEDIKRHPLNVIIATMNVGTNGSNPLNQALANRFRTPYILDDPTRETFINIIEKASGKGRDVCEWVYEAYEATCQYLRDPDVNEEEICQNLSIRTCLGAIENMEEGQSPIRALINSIVGAVAVVDVEVARNLQREKIECLPNPAFEF